MSRQEPVGGDSAGPVRAVEVDLGIAVDRGLPLPLPDQLEAELRGLIARGELRAGAQLPGTRGLAAQLGVSRGIVVEAYDRLQRQGVIEIHQGAPVRVADSVAPAGGAGEAPVAEPPAARIRLHPALVPPATLDRRAWRRRFREALEQATEDELRSTGLTGLGRLRAAVAEQLARSRGVATSADRVLITGGVTHALGLIAPMLRERGPVAVEEPGFLVHRATLAAAGCELVLVPVDEHGIDVAALSRTRARSVLVTPAHQMPLGQPLAADRRAALLRWAGVTDGLVIEDDYDGELRYDRRSVRALQAAATDRVLYLGTTSKVLSPALRVGWLVAPGALIPELRLRAEFTGGTPGTIEQLAVALALETGDFDRSVARLRRRCAAQRAALLAAIGEHAPQLEPEGVEAGLALTLRARGLDWVALASAAAAKGIELYPVGDGPDAILPVGFGDVHESRAADIARELGALVAAARATA